MAVNRVSLEVSQNEILGILGPSGSGKTTLLRLIAGLERPDEGNIIIDGEQVSTPDIVKPPSKRQISLIFQDLALWPHMSVRQNVEFVISGNGLPKKRVREMADKVLEWVHLGSHSARYPSELSGGEQQRLAIARSIINQPKYLFMDEPFSHLDPLLIEDIQQIIDKLQKVYNTSIIYVTHNLGVALSFADRLAIMKKGSIQQIGDREEVIHNPENNFVRQFLQAEVRKLRLV
ncbi:MAG: ABC transporter ATP-binding protein [bacterium]